jgi:hypothetical protein
MSHYFDNLDTLQQFTMELDRHTDTLACKHCQNSGQFVSHGFVFKKHYNGDKRVVGKRLFCSNRYRRKGCGRTLRLYLSEQIPKLAYSTIELTLFLCALIAGDSIQQAYQKATHCSDTRNAYRWLDKLERKLTDYRQHMKRSTQPPSGQFLSRTRRLQVLLPTIVILLKSLGSKLCQHYQLRYQQAFM